MILTLSKRSRYHSSTTRIPDSKSAKLQICSSPLSTVSLAHSHLETRAGAEGFFGVQCAVRSSTRNWSAPLCSL